MQFIEFASGGLTLPKLVLNIPTNGLRYILLYYLFPHTVYSVCLWRFNIAKISFSNIPANGMRYILLYYLFPQAVY